MLFRSQKILAAFQAHDKEQFEKFAALMLKLIDDSDAIVGTRKEMLLGTWIRDARAWGSSPTEADLCEYNARLLPTVWAEPTILADYANRTWAGLLKDFYRPRWAMWLEALRVSLKDGSKFDEKATRNAIRDWEFAWVKKTTPIFATEPSGDTIVLAAKIYSDYNPILQNLYGDLSFKPTAQLLTGCRWEYHAEGRTLWREFLPDGTIQAYEKDGSKVNWFQPFTWKIQGQKILLTKPGKTITLRMANPETLLFTSEGWGEGKRVNVK